MITQVIDHINTQLETLKFIKERRSFCEQIKDGDKSFPAEWCDREYRHVSDYDFKKGLSYHRMIGAVSSEESDDNISGCNLMSERTYPMRLVVVVDKKQAGVNTAGGDITLAESVINTIDFNTNKVLMSTLKAENVSVISASYLTDRYQVHDLEYEEIKMRFAFEYSVIAIDYNIVIKGDNACFDNLCD